MKYYTDRDVRILQQIHSQGNKAVQFLTISLFHRSVYGRISSTPPQPIHIYRKRVVWQLTTLKDRICGIMGYFSTKGRSSFKTINLCTLIYYTKCMTPKQEVILASYAHSKNWANNSTGRGCIDQLKNILKDAQFAKKSR